MCGTIFNASDVTLRKHKIKTLAVKIIKQFQILVSTRNKNKRQNNGEFWLHFLYITRLGSLVTGKKKFDKVDKT